MSNMSVQDALDKSIVFFDGDCGLCNRSVQFVLRHERKKNLYFSALQSEFTKEFFEENGFEAPNLSTFYFYDNYHLHSKSRGALHLLTHLKWYLQPLRLFSVIPVCQRDQLYDFIAKRRKSFAKSHCVVPSTEQVKRILLTTS